MANVLPPDDRRILKRRFTARLILTGALTLLGGAAIASLALIPAYMAVRVAEASLQSKEDQAAGQGADQAAIGRAQALVNALLPLANATSSPSDTLAFALGLKTTGLSITSMQYTKGQIVLSGVAGKREAVSEFRDALQASGKFASVAVPVAALVGVQEGRFTITLTGAF